MRDLQTIIAENLAAAKRAKAPRNQRAPQGVTPLRDCMSPSEPWADYPQYHGKAKTEAELDAIGAK